MPKALSYVPDTACSGCGEAFRAVLPEGRMGMGWELGGGGGAGLWVMKGGKDCHRVTRDFVEASII